MDIHGYSLEGYDGHIIFKELNNFDDIDIQIIPRTSEKYVSIVNTNIIFLDSNQSYKAKLDDHALNLENSDFKHLISELFKDVRSIKKKRCISI